MENVTLNLEELGLAEMNQAEMMETEGDTPIKQITQIVIIME